MRTILFILLVLSVQSGIASQQRLALVIGNAAYQNESPLVNTLNDARDIATKLDTLGFEVTKIENASRRSLTRRVNQFVRTAQGTDAVVLIYYSGHGLQVGGQNYLLPIDAQITDELDVPSESLSVDQILAGLGDRGHSAVNLLILDACRDNPYKQQGNKSIGDKGLARVKHAPTGTLILYATKPGETASDNPQGRNGLFTQHLLTALDQPGKQVEDVFKEVAEKVYLASNGQQDPWPEGRIRGQFYFAPPVAPPPPPRPDPELLFWQSCVQSGQASCYQAYLNRYPNGRFVTAARANLTSPLPNPPRHDDPATRESELGLTRQERIAIQQALNTLRFPVGVADGIWGRNTRAGIKAWQQSVGRTASGYFTAVGYKALLAQAQQQQVSPVDTALTGDMVPIKGGCFEMGSPSSEKDRDDDETQHRVCVSDFSLAKHEVTVKQFRRFVAATGYQTDAEKNAGGVEGCYSLKDNKWQWVKGRYWDEVGFSQEEAYPVACVSWNDANAYVDWLNRQTGGGYQLPTEAQWEYAARAGSQRSRFWGNSEAAACAFANVADENTSRGTSWNNKFPCDDGFNFAAPVGQKKPNAFGLHDMLGNVWEWTCSDYDKAYQGGEQRCSTGGARRAYRGGSWSRDPRFLRSAFRYRNAPDNRDSNLGFRLARTSN